MFVELGEGPLNYQATWDGVEVSLAPSLIEGAFEATGAIGDIFLVDTSAMTATAFTAQVVDVEWH